jgi:hypothetical protein
MALLDTIMNYALDEAVEYAAPPPDETKLEADNNNYLQAYKHLIILRLMWSYTISIF